MLTRLFKILILVTFYFSTQLVFANEDGALDSKVWIWTNAFQVQLMDPVSGAFAIIYLEYGDAKEYVIQYDIDVVPGKGGFVPPSLGQFTNLESLIHLKELLLGPNLKVVNTMSRPKEINGKIIEVFLPLRLEDQDYWANHEVSDESKFLYRVKQIIDQVMVHRKSMRAFFMKNKPVCYNYLIK